MLSEARPGIGEWAGPQILGIPHVFKKEELVPSDLANGDERISSANAPLGLWYCVAVP